MTKRASFTVAELKRTMAVAKEFGTSQPVPLIRRHPDGGIELTVRSNNDQIELSASEWDQALGLDKA